MYTEFPILIILSLALSYHNVMSLVVTSSQRTRLQRSKESFQQFPSHVVPLKRKTALFLNKQHNDPDTQEGTKPNQEDSTTEKKDLFIIEEPRLLVGDIVSMLLTCQLLGLVDVLNTPEFWMNGGFVQPVDLSPNGLSTLSTLVRRDSMMSISWILSAIKNNAYFLGTVVDDITAIKCSLTIFTDYCSLLIIFALSIAFATNAPVDAVEILRQSYFTLLILCTFRVIYGRFNV